MQHVTYDLIISKYPCYNPTIIGMPTDYKDTPVNFVNNYRNKVKKISDIQWVLLRLDFLTHKELSMYVIWCVRQVQHLMKDERSIKALDVAEAYVHGSATKEELLEARNNAFDAYHAARADATDATDAVDYAAAYIAADVAAYANAADDDAVAYAAYRVANANAVPIRDALIDKLLEIFKEKEAA